MDLGVSLLLGANESTISDFFPIVVNNGFQFKHNMFIHRNEWRNWFWSLIIPGSQRPQKSHPGKELRAWADAAVQVSALTLPAFKMEKEEEHLDIFSSDVFQLYLTIPKSPWLQFWLIIASLAHERAGVELISLPPCCTCSVLQYPSKSPSAALLSQIPSVSLNFGCSN